MKTLYNYIRHINISTTLTEASLLDEIDDIIASGDKYAQKKEIVEWLKENDDFVCVFAKYQQNEKMFKDPNQLNINSKGQIDLNVFKPFNSYTPNKNKYIDLPIPEYVKINTVKAFDVVGNRDNLAKIDFSKLPKIEKCNNMLLRCWDGRRNKWLPSLSKLNIDEISVLTIDIEGTHPQEWPKNKVKCLYLFGNTITNYDEDFLEEIGYNYNLHNLKGLHTNELIVPDCFITENIAFMPLQNAIKKDTVIDKENFPYEWQNLNVIFESKSFDKLYCYSCSNHFTDHKYKEIKKTGDSYIIKGRATNVLAKYYE